jgi:hypothetical protein
MEPGWRGDSVARDARGATRQGFRPGTSGGWRAPRGRSASATRAERVERDARDQEGGPGGAYPGTLGVRGVYPEPPSEPGEPFRAGDIADRGPLERGTMAALDQRARDARELERQRAWRDAAERAIETSQSDEARSAEEPELGEEGLPEGQLGSEWPGSGEEALAPVAGSPPEGSDSAGEIGAQPYDRLGPQAPDGYATALPTIRVVGFGVSRKRLEQAIRELQLPVVVVREIEDADVVITLKNYYRQKPPALREAEERTIPIYVLKSNTIIQMESCLTSLYAIEVDPREAALRETEEAIGLVLHEARPVELSPQNAYIRRLQHQMAEQANVVSQSRGREPYRRVRLYPDKVRAWR